MRSSECILNLLSFTLIVKQSIPNERIKAKSIIIDPLCSHIPTYSLTFLVQQTMVLLGSKKNAHITINKVSSLLFSYLIVAAFILNTTRADAIDETVQRCYGDLVCRFPSPFNPGCFFGGQICRERTFILHLPPDVSSGDSKKKKFPLVLNLHALGSNAALQQSYSGFDEEVADKEGIIVAYPQGITGFFANLIPNITPIDSPVFSLNAGGCCAPSIDVQNPEIVDDVTFLREMVKHIRTEMSKEFNFEIDMERIYAIGMSNGGFMTNRIGCQMRDIIAAIAPVAGPLMENAGPSPVFKADPFTCNPKDPVPVLHFHHRDDRIVPFNGNSNLGFPSIPSSIARWREINNIGNEPVVNDEPDQNTKCSHYSPNTSSSVSLCVIDTTGNPNFSNHCWPGKDCENDVGNQYIWNFLKKYTLSGFVGDSVDTEDKITSPVLDREEL